MTTAFTVTVCVSSSNEQASAIEEIVAGLASNPKTLNPKFLYHKEGARLFDEITRIEEYYPTRVERSLLENFGSEIVRDVAPQEIVELGPGNSAKSGALIGPALEAGALRRYIPFDISESAVREGAEALTAAYPNLPEITAVVGDFGSRLSSAPPASGPRLIAFLGSTIGNFHPDEQLRFLANVRGLIPAAGGALLAGVDLVKDVPTIEAAYNDARGVTALFNLNALNAVNDIIGAGIDVSLFRHRAFFNAEHSRIEMRLEATADVAIALPDGRETTIRAGETIWTESSYKFTKEGFAATLANAGFSNIRWFTDPNSLFALALARP